MRTNDSEGTKTTLTTQSRREKNSFGKRTRHRACRVLYYYLRIILFFLGKSLIKEHDVDILKHIEPVSPATAVYPVIAVIH